MIKRKRAVQSRVSDKIAVLKREGKSTKEAAGEAYGMEREGRLKAGGKYERVGRKGRRGRRGMRA